SPNAAKIGAASASRPAAEVLVVRDIATRNRSGRGREILLNQLHLRRPAALVRRKGLGAPFERNPIETRFGNGQQYASRSLFQFERHERSRLFRVIDAAIHREWMPPKRKQSHRLDPLDRKLETKSLVWFLPGGDFSVHASRNNL